MGDDPRNLADLKQSWTLVWPQALDKWNHYLQLSEPRWCFTEPEETREHLTGSFAMIRLIDHSVVISLRQVRDLGLQPFAVEIMAHEIGHHVYCPADLTDHARLLARSRTGLPTKEHLAPFVANLYTDLLINDRLQRLARLNLSGVYLKLGSNSADRMWTFYMRIYELLWDLDRACLAKGSIDARLNYDAQLGARLVRSYAKDWLEGAGRFAALCLPYVLQDDAKRMQGLMAPWRDTQSAGQGGMPDGLVEVEPSEQDGAIHPAMDEELSGVKDAAPGAPAAEEEEEEGAAEAQAQTEAQADSRDTAEAGPQAAGATGPQATGATGHKTLKRYREPFEYAEILKAAGVDLPDSQITARYYRERALPHLIRFPQRETPQSIDPLPEGLDVWDTDSPVEDIDWVATVVASPQIIPGVTTRQRMYGTSPGTSPQAAPVDLYLGVDCSGSMLNPASGLSYPVLAGAVMALSALRAGSRVMVALSGEPGKTVTTDGFVRDEPEILRVLTGYLGTGTTFGIHRLREAFATMTAASRPAHILIITDTDIFSLLNMTIDGRLGWDVAREAAEKARGGATYVLEVRGAILARAAAAGRADFNEERMRLDGWDAQHVGSMEELVDFARRFSQARYGPAGRIAAGK